MLDARPGKVLMIPHIVEIDEAALPVLRTHLGDDLLNLRDVYPGMYPPATVQASFLAGAYARMDVVLGMRGHSNIIPFGMGTPCIAVGHHPKNRYFLTEIGRPDLVLDQNAETGGYDVGQLVELIGGVIDDADLRPALRRRFDALDAIASVFDRRLLALIDA